MLEKVVKCYIIPLLRLSYIYWLIPFNNLTIKNSKEVKILGMKRDNSLNYNNHIKSICRKAGQKLGAFFENIFWLQYKTKKLLYKSMIKSQFNYSPLVWMFRSRQSIHGRSLRISQRSENQLSEFTWNT